MDEQLEERVAALERAITDDEGDPTALAEAAVTAERLDETEATLEDLEDRVAELEAATQALRGYVGNVRSVNREVEERADLALSRVEALTGRAGTPPEDRAGSWSERGNGSEQLRGGTDTPDDEHLGDEHRGGDGNHDVGPGAGREQQPRSGRCGRCGRPTGAGPEPDGSSRPGPEAATAGRGADGRETPASGVPPGALDASDGGELESNVRDSPMASTWNETGASGPAGHGVRAGDGPDADGPIDRLRQLL